MTAPEWAAALDAALAFACPQSGGGNCCKESVDLWGTANHVQSLLAEQGQSVMRAPPSQHSHWDGGHGACGPERG